MTTAAAAPDAPVAAKADAAAPGEDAAPRIDYATPWPKHAWAPSAPAQRLFWHAVRKVVFAGGLGLLVYGLASVAGGVNRHVAPVAAAWGIAFVVMMLPAPYLWARQPRRRRRGARAAPSPPSGI